MVGPITNMQLGQTAMLSPSLDYDVLIIGAGQVGHCLPQRISRKAKSMRRVGCTPYIECVSWA